ncbi:hypothetical protein EIN_512120 [Entamoeba invadens IP1]|uniref:Uncharacterized protein n=1 Tax=Entamoeba invadens IP1 TaxID=370355 RepID=A0A0A1U9B1_ENTIV|nr:hypothetical protein EIN_512120 [Entamoeba invadens IP1]ELP91509.1 hypothetical protein EIN_512120 [Entamoeba invadens IP1]|eukprot:XP_004258280.1 hypothetical protein EIN_512120 [Entamoeba invadens IP1]
MICKQIDSMVHTFYTNNKNEAPFERTLKENVQKLVETDEIDDLDLFPYYNSIREEIEFNLLFTLEKRKQLFQLSKLMDNEIDVEGIKKAIGQVNELKQKNKEFEKSLQDEKEQKNQILKENETLKTALTTTKNENTELKTLLQEMPVGEPENLQQISLDGEIS